MIAVFVDERYRTIARAPATPACGEFCDSCGDCLRCFGEDACGSAGDHQWIVYAGSYGEWRRDHPEAEEWLDG